VGAGLGAGVAGEGEEVPAAGLAGEAVAAHQAGPPGDHVAAHLPVLVAEVGGADPERMGEAEVIWLYARSWRLVFPRVN